MAIKANIGNPQDKKTYKFELTDEQGQALTNKKIGDKVPGKSIGHEGYEFEITGGSDHCGFPMRKDVTGTARKKILITKGIGMREKRKGLRVRKTVAGNTVHEQTAQINMKVLKAGKTPLGGEPEEAQKTDEQQAETSAKEKKE